MCHLAGSIIVCTTARGIKLWARSSRLVGNPDSKSKARRLYVEMTAVRLVRTLRTDEAVLAAAGLPMDVPISPALLAS